VRRLRTGEPLWAFPVAPAALRAREGFESTKLWVDHLAWSADGSHAAAAAGRVAVLAETGVGGVVSTTESPSGTVTGLAFLGGRELAVASYGEVRWVLPVAVSPRGATLRRAGAAVECLGVAPNGESVAVGYLDKTLRVFAMGASASDSGGGGNTTRDINGNVDGDSTRATHSNNNNNNNTRTPYVDWVGFGAAVRSVRFSSGSWLAAMGGNSVLVIPDGLDSRSEPPIVCRTPGRTEADGCDGSCHRFAGIRWSSSSSSPPVLAALDAKTGEVHVFCFSGRGGNDCGSRPANDYCHREDAWPVRFFPTATVSPSFLSRPPATRLATTAFAFFPMGPAEDSRHPASKDFSFRVLDWSGAKERDEASVATDGKSDTSEAPESSLRV